jgi:hypothetical protein
MSTEAIQNLSSVNRARSYAPLLRFDDVQSSVAAGSLLANPAILFPREAAAFAKVQPDIAIARAAPAQLTTNQTVQGPQARELALLAADVYNDIPNPPAGFRVAGDADLGRLGLRTSDLTSTQSPFRARVYVTGAGADAKYVVTMRGSVTGADWRSNFQQGLGISTDHYRKALAIGQQLAKFGGNANITIAGHSLGGGLASAAAIASGRDAATFNASGLSRATLNQAQNIHNGAGVSRSAQVNAYFVRGDILSTIQDGGDRVIGGILGGLLGATIVDAPEAYGNRIGLSAVRPENLRWYQDNPVARHGMDWVLSSMPGR